MIGLLDVTAVRALVRELRRTMRGLLFDLCDEVEHDYADAVASLGLPVGYFRLLGQTLPTAAFSGWKAVGWIEELNDLLYFLDVRRQLRNERGGAAAARFASDLLAECETHFYEHHYTDDLFPLGRPESTALPARLAKLCARIARQVVQESVGLIPGLPSAWLREAKRSCWEVPCDLSAQFERAELAGCLPIGLDGTCLVPPREFRAAMTRTGFQCTLVFGRKEARVRVGTRSSVLPGAHGEAGPGWRARSPLWIRPPGPDGDAGLTLGPTLVYGRLRQPVRLIRSDPALATRIGRALDAIAKVWPEGSALLGCLTSRVVPLRAPGVVSYSYRHRPGLSFINCFERDDLDLMDDLVHENSHHHLNLLLRKFRLSRGDANQEVFYSPWRRSLRPLRGILHATFTFTMGALLFAHLTSRAESEESSKGRSRNGRGVGLSARALARARARGLEEVESVRYSLRDLRGPAMRLGWLTRGGRELVGELGRHVTRAARRLVALRGDLEASREGRRLRRHREELELARERYRIRRRPRAKV